MKNPFKSAYYYFLLKCTKKYRKTEAYLTRTLRFYREGASWYVDLPEWQGFKGALAMVAGADEALALLADHRGEVTLDVSNNPDIYHAWKLSYKVYVAESVKDSYGDYIVHGLNEKKIWLCSVLTFVFGGYPKYLYFKVASK